MPTLKALQDFNAYPDGFTRRAFTAGEVFEAENAFANSLLIAKLAEPHKHEAAKAAEVVDGKTLAELKDAIGAPNLKEVGEAVERLGHDLESHKGAVVIPLAIFETVVNKHEAAKAAEVEAAAKAEADAKAAEEEAAIEAEKAAKLAEEEAAKGTVEPPKE